MRKKMKVPDLEVLNAYERGVLQDNLGRAFPIRVQVLHTLFKKCNSNISLTSAYLQLYFPCFQLKNRNSLSTILRRYDSYHIALEQLEKDVKLYGPEMSGCMDEETLKKLLWKIQKRIYQRCIPGEANETLDLEEEND